MPQLTVVLLTYNHETSIAKAIDSILEQETNFDFDIHILDDCSKDATARICTEYKNKFPDKIKLFVNEKNLGAIKNVKQGYLRITAKYFAFLEGDDYWCDPHKLQLQFDAMEAHPECMICAHNVLFNDLVKNIEYPFIEKDPGSTTHIYTLEDRLFIHPSARLYRNNIDLKNIPDHMVVDVHMFNLYLTKGDLYYIHKIMSVYNKTGTGYWSGMSPRDRRITALEWQYESNKYFDFVYEARLYKTSTLLKFLKYLLGIKPGWRAFFYLETARLYIKYFFKRSPAQKSPDTDH